MSSPGSLLHGFTYGEHLEGIAERSLGYRLLTPVEPQPWSAEVETLARRLQMAPYPEHWPPTDLFCSVLLADGQRLVALARYGLADHTPSRRRGGLELVGVVGPARLDLPSARAIYRWLRQRRAEVDDLHALGGKVALEDATARGDALPQPPASEPAPVLPVRLWQEGVLLFAATAPSDPDHRLSLLEQDDTGKWQWLPLVGADFPWAAYAPRGPVFAWTAHLSGVALKLDRPAVEPPARTSGRRWPAAVLALLLLGLLSANLWALLTLRSQLGIPVPTAAAPAEAVPPRERPASPPASDEARDRFALALHALLLEQGGRREWTQTDERLLAEYRRLVQTEKYRDLSLADSNTKGRLAVGAASVLSQRSADRVEETVRKALTDKGFHPRLVDAACELVHQQMIAESK
jgi:hypothetical protein